MSGVVPKKASSLWTIVPWILPDWLTPPWVQEKIERAVYDGFTRHEWFQAQVNEFHEEQRKRSTGPIGTPQVSKGTEE